MTKKLVQHGNSAALVIEKPILQLLGIDMDTDLQIVTDGKNIIISPVKSAGDEVIQSLERINAAHHKTLKRLAE